MSLYVVFGIVAVMIIIATAMTGIGLMNLNVAQSFYNGSIAQNEAEAAVASLLYNVSNDIYYGLNTEKISGTITDGFDKRECYHVLTFDKSQGLPWSVNAKDAAQTGYQGRTVPKSMVSGYATGFCRGQFRTIEVLIYRPPYPYAIASSGRIYSNDHIRVDGVDSTQDAKNGKNKRPGHIFSSYTGTGSAKPDPDNPGDYAVYIGDEGGENTYISGFILSPGHVLVKPPATVKEGVRAQGDKVGIPNINVREKYYNAGDEGVIKIVSEGFASSQKLDAMYFRQGNLTYAGNVEMSNAFLYLKNGTLEIDGGLTGCGAIVVENGRVLIKGDAALNGNNRIAVICDGDVTFQGNNNYFQGLVYSHGNVSAKDITIVGNLILDGRDSTGNADTSRNIALSNVKAMSNSEETGAISFTAQSSTDAETAYSGKYTSNQLPCIGINVDPNTGIASIGVNDQGNWWIGHCFAQNGASGVAFVEQQLTEPDLETMNYTGEYGDADPTLEHMLADMKKLADDYKAAKDKFDQTPPTITEHHDSPPPGHDEQVPNPAYIELQALMADLNAQYKKAVQDFATACYDKYKETTNNGCTYNTGGKNINVSKPFTFDVNEFLITGNKLKVMYWHIYNTKL